MRKTYMAIQIEQDGKWRAEVRAFSTGWNIWHDLRKIKGLQIATTFDSKKETERIVEMWNAGFREQGKYLIEYPLF